MHKDLILWQTTSKDVIKAVCTKIDRKTGKECGLLRDKRGCVIVLNCDNVWNAMFIFKSLYNKHKRTLTTCSLKVNQYTKEIPYSREYDGIIFNERGELKCFLVSRTRLSNI